MQQLTEKQTRMISGGYEYKYIFVTQQWKEDQAVISGTVFSAVFGIMAGIMTSSYGFATALCGVCAGTIVGYSLGYACSVLENSDLEEDSWYIFTD